MRECSVCWRKDNRRRMERGFNWTEFHKAERKLQAQTPATEGTALEAETWKDAPNPRKLEWEFEYFTCVDCVAARECCGEAEAVARIGGASYSRRMERAAGFKEAVNAEWEDLAFVEGNAPSKAALASHGVAADSAVRGNLHLLDDEGNPTEHLERVRQYVQERAPLKRRPEGVGGAPGPPVDPAAADPDQVWTPETTDEEDGWEERIPQDPEGEMLVTAVEWETMDRKAKKQVVRHARKLAWADYEWKEGCGPAAKGWVSKAEWDCLSKRRKKALVRRQVNHSRPWLAKFLAPVLELIKLKQDQMELAEQKARKLGEWIAEQADELGKDATEAEEELDKIGGELKAAQAPLSFRNAPPEHQERLRLAADYTDEWWAASDSTFRAYYVCMAGRGAGWDNKPTYCCSVTVSADWARMFSDPLQRGQRWYCPECAAGYKTRFGFLLELVTPTQTLYIRAPHHDKLDIKDFKAMMVERAHGKGVTTGEELLELIPNATPVGADWLVPGSTKGTYRFSLEVFEGLATWDWMNFFRAIKK